MPFDDAEKAESAGFSSSVEILVRQVREEALHSSAVVAPGESAQRTPAAGA